MAGSSASGILDRHASDGIVFDLQRFDTRTEQELDVPRQQRRVQTPGQRIAQMQRRPSGRAQPLQRILRNKMHDAQG